MECRVEWIDNTSGCLEARLEIALRELRESEKSVKDIEGWVRSVWRASKMAVSSAVKELVNGDKRTEKVRSGKTMAALE